MHIFCWSVFTAYDLNIATKMYIADQIYLLNFCKSHLEKSLYLLSIIKVQSMKTGEITSSDFVGWICWSNKFYVDTLTFCCMKN